MNKDEYLEKQKNSYKKIDKKIKSAKVKQKFISLETLLNILGKKKITVVVASGTFLLPHFAHSDYLEQAKKYGDILVVCMNSDESIKINQRCPLFVPDYGRVTDIASRESVDYVLIFDEKTPKKIINYLKPKYYAKGSDWFGHKIPDITGSPKTEVIFIKHRYNFSSNKLTDNIIKYDKKLTNI